MNIKITAGLCFFATILAQAMPTTITYQGSIKQKGAPLPTGTYTASFQIIDYPNGVLRPDWLLQGVSVNVTNGLFSVTLDPQNLDWQNLVNPKLQVTFGQEVLSPPEPINAGIYALMSQSIVDGAVTTQKLAPEVQDHLVPSGAIMLFGTACPTGWTRFSALDNRFPLGASTGGTTGGSPSQGWYAFFTSQGNGSTQFFSANTGAINIGSSVYAAPPYLTMVYCQKQ